jgi:hypothetical protein
VSGHLKPDEYKSCLVSLGYSLGKDKLIREVSTSSFQRIMVIVDPNNSGYVLFDAFLDFDRRESPPTWTRPNRFSSYFIPPDIFLFFLPIAGD